MESDKDLRLFIDKTKEDFCFDALAVRVLDPLNYIPFAVHNGLSTSFVEDESLISITDCVCGKVAGLDTQGKCPFFTEQGSFWCNSLKEEVAEELKKIGINPRGRCLVEGYKTLLIAPISRGNGVGGSLFLASKKENLLTKEDVNFLESEAIRLGEEVLKKMTECDKYNIIVRWIAQSNGEDKKTFNKYFEHLKTCSSCHDFYSHNLELDNFIMKTLAQPSPPPKLQSKIMDKLSHC